MNVLLTGASGFIGSHLARALRAADYVVIEARRDVAAGTAAVQADFTRDLSAREWLPKLRGVDAVINAVGILREHGDQTFERIHKRAPQALFTACVAAGVRRVVQISALGADLGVTRYFVSKRAADDYLTCLRAVYAQASYVTINISSPNTKGLRELQNSIDLAA